MAHDVEKWLEAETGRIGPDIYQRTLNTSPWLKLVQQGPWPDEMGHTINVLTYERSLPNNGSAYTPNSWTVVSENDGSSNNSGNCNPAASKVNFATSKRTYSIFQTAIESPDLCVNDLRHPVYRKQQLGMIMNILTENTSQVWIERFREEYVRVANNKVVLRPDGAGNLGTLAGPNQNGYDQAFRHQEGASTSRLTMGLLKKVYMRMIREGAGNNPLSRENARPVFGLICDSETSEDLLKNSNQLRDDIRWSTKANDLLAPLGVDRSYQGFFHLNDDFGPRWNFVSNAWVRVWPYIPVETSSGSGKYKMDNNPAYETATHVDSIIFHTDVMKSLTPKPITSPGGGTQFDAVNYRGDFKWLNIQDRVHNPDKNIGFFRGVFQNATEPIFPQYGWVIRHLRCSVDDDAVACS